jgi:hypothetical protein
MRCGTRRAPDIRSRLIPGDDAVFAVERELRVVVAEGAAGAMVE